MLRIIERALSIVAVGLAVGWLFVLTAISTQISVATAAQFTLGLLVVAAIFWAAFLLLRNALTRLRGSTT